MVSVLTRRFSQSDYRLKQEGLVYSLQPLLSTKILNSLYGLEKFGAIMAKTETNVVDAKQSPQPVSFPLSHPMDHP
ncbi:hypothetical protein ALP45_200036 [Pseudomonas coronafaciens pv. atropurpurea]|nr:hypothetical protein ALO66_200051 [Pseudomonas coronafaciens pv. atropurpurea]RMT61118.1 hypothetical protein ALP45_200036 [Pseudomonas coronafaciens pv. atropurpurea]RMV71790.1 hypothetical protein ALP06_200222 [Pseudomonas coronafaciens pv. atropurpurea]